MDTAIWISVVSTFGVVASAFIQWRSNKTTVKAAAVREAADREERKRLLTEAKGELAREREHQILSAAATDERVMALKKWEAQIALSEGWRPKRLRAHLAVLRAIDVNFRAVRDERWAFFMSMTRQGPLPEEAAHLHEAADAFESATLDVVVFSSEASSRCLEDVRMSFQSLQDRFMEKRVLSSDEPVTADEMNAIDWTYRNLDQSITEYRKAVRDEIGMDGLDKAVE